MKLGTALLVGAGLVVAGAIVASLYVIGPPSVQRERRLDAAREQDLAGLERLIDAYARGHDELPEDLATLTRGNAAPRSRDPESGEPYGYERLDERRYRLCATFRTSSAEDSPSVPDVTWAHGAGRTCYERRASRAR